jgi:lipopolysaccharide/colanic/teichoic acid biosynthesis glycosyltransferase
VGVASYPAAKRALDLSISLVLLVLLLPVFALVFVVMAVDVLRCRRDRGPLLYRELRMSRGRPFELLKFRTLRSEVLATMGPDAHARMHEADEANLTWAGRRLLKPWYLDELPQLWNVLRGDMSLVGPRPWPPSMVAKQVAAGLTYRNELIAGWTGPVQVEKGLVAPADYTALDIAYVHRCRTATPVSLVLVDVGLLWRTVKVMARGEGLNY